MQVTVPKKAPAGETIRFSAAISVINGTSPVTATDSAKVTVAKAATTSPTPTKSKSPTSPAGAGGSSGTIPGGATADIGGLSRTTLGVGTSIPIGALPAVAGVSTTIPGGNAANLFPQIRPSSAPSPVPGSQADPQRAQPVADSSRIPLSLGSSEFGAQIVGLIVLLLGLVIAVTRLSLRKARTTGTK